MLKVRQRNQSSSINRRPRSYRTTAVLLLAVVGSIGVLLQTNSVESRNKRAVAKAPDYAPKAPVLLPAGPTTFSNATSISIGDSNPKPTAATPYPSDINVSGMAGVVSTVTVNLSGISLGRPDDMDVLLVSPSGQNLLLMSDAGGVVTPAVGVNLNFDDAAGPSLPDNGPLVSGTFKPSNFGAGDTFALPAPPASTATQLASFNGTDPNGTWSLYVVDDAAGGATGTIASGWSITITTVAGAATTTVVSSSQNPSFTTPPLDSVTLTASVSSGSGTPTGGTVQFKDNGVNIGGPVLLVTGTASTVTSFATEGAHLITADYSGNPGLFGPSSGSLIQMVNNHTAVTGNQFCNNGTISIGDTAPKPTSASPYPSNVFVSGLSGTVASVTVNLTNVTHGRPDDLDILLVGPSGGNLLLLSDAGGVTAVTNQTIVFDDAAASTVPDNGPLVAGTFKPSNFAPADTFNSPAPTLSGASTLATFTGTDPNGMWSLYVVDDSTGGVVGTIGGWCLTVTTSGAAPTTTTVVSSLNPSFTTAPGNSVMFTAAVTSGSGTPNAGTVQFKDNGVNIGAPVAVSSGAASINTTFSTEGNHVITASYSGDPGNFGPSSGSVLQEVNNHTVVNGNEFCNPGPINLTDFNQTGQIPSPAVPYPSKVFVSGLSGTVCRVQLTLNGVSTTRPRDLDLLLVGPTGSSLIVMSDAGGTSSTVTAPVNLILDDSAASNLPDDSGGPLTSGSFKPTNYLSGDIFTAPAPAPSGSTTFAGAFNGGSANGTWSLYVLDDAAGGGGGSIGSWCLTFTVDTATQITSQPTDQIACEGGAASFSVTAAGGGTVTYQWRRGTTPLLNGGNISGADTPTLSINPVSASDAATDYNVVVTGTCGSVTSNNVTLTVNPAPATPTITASPSSVCPNSSGNQASGPAGAATYSWSIINGTIDGPANGQTVSYTAGAFGSVSLTLTVTNGAGCSASNTLNVPIVNDTTAPTVSCPSPTSASADASCQAAIPNVIPGVTASDDCTPTGSLTLSQSPAAGTIVGIGPHTITVTATDTAGNSSSCTTTFTVTDDTAPSVSCPSGTTASADSSCQAAIPNLVPNVSASDNCTASGSLTITQSPAAGTLVGVGLQTITVTATDASGNSSSCTTSFTVVDSTPPTVTCPGPSSASGDPSTCQAPIPNVVAAVSASDNCTASGSLSITQSPAAGTLVGGGPHTIVVTVTDEAGNSSTCSTLFTVTDVTGPTITLNGQTPSLWPPNHAYQTFNVSDFVVSASDSCDATVNLSSVYILNVTSDEVENGNGDGDTLNDIVIAANCQSVQLRAERAGGGDGRVYTITFKVKDSSGNFATATAKVVVPKSQNGSPAVDSGPQYTINSSCP